MFCCSVSHLSRQFSITVWISSPKSIKALIIYILVFPAILFAKSLAGYLLRWGDVNLVDNRLLNAAANSDS